MATLKSSPVKIEVRPDAKIPPESSTRTVLDVVYSRVIKVPKESSEKIPTGEPTFTAFSITDTLRFELDTKFTGTANLPDVEVPSRIRISFLGDDGRALVTRSIDAKQVPEDSKDIILSDAEIEAILKTLQAPEEVKTGISRSAVLVSVSVATGSLNFPGMLLQIAPVDYDEAKWEREGLSDILESGFGTAAAVLQAGIPKVVAGLSWRISRIAVDGKFSCIFTDDEKQSTGWAWLLTGNSKPAMLGIVIEAITSGRPTRSILLPTAAEPSNPRASNNLTNPNLSSSKPATETKDCSCDTGSHPPAVVSESELANNPQVFSEDPGSFCKPFSNPERILSERSFYTILRAEAPAISAEASKNLEEPVALDFDPPDEMFASINESSVQQGLDQSFSAQSLNPDTSKVTRAGLPEDSKGLLSATNLTTKIGNASRFNQILFPRGFSDIVNKMDRGRMEMSARNPAQWDSHALRYQATTVAVGHILEFRMRTRSNGYSLGGVAKTLTLAPRQTRRIQKVEWSRSERASRIESTQAGDTVNDSSDHTTSYTDAVSATLNEWAQGSSKSSVTSAAAGAGAVLGPVVIGGGVAHSSASSSSQQSGGRNTAGNEESNWRDAIRRHGDSLRKFESMVVQEVTQNEEVTGTVEVVRNINYAHSLTVIYHNILRHLRVDTEFAGARECLFVPFAMKPFSMQRVYRWRETLGSVLKDRKYRHALTNLKDVLTGFKYSKIPPGIRANHQIRSMYGSIYIELGVARPQDADDGKFKMEYWNVLNPYLPIAALGIWQIIAGQAEHLRDYLYQKNYAPAIAAKWCNVLELRSNDGTVIEADFTLATAYSYNRSVRIDFQVNPRQSLTRSMMTAIHIKATYGLSPGSVANVRSLNFTYQTDYESGRVTSSQGKGDLVDPGTGDRDLNGALLTLPLTMYEQQNPRADLVFEVMGLLEHFNEHIEYYHKMIWWRMDRDKLYMLIDGFVVPKSNPITSIASVVERDPIAVAGNCLVFRVSAGSFVGSAQAKTPEDLYNWYDNRQPTSSPMHISLPTDGLYAQTIIDECNSLEEHYGNHDWALNNPDPELGNLDPSLLQSRRAESGNLDPTKLPETIINLSNGGQAPAPQGLGAALAAVTNANAFRDMAGLAGTQGLAQAGLETAAGLATSFGGSAAGIKLAEIAAKKQAVEDVDKKLASIKRAKDKNLATDEVIQESTMKALGELSGPPESVAPHEDKSLQNLIMAASTTPNSTVSAQTKSGAVQVAYGVNATRAGSIIPAARRFTAPAYVNAVNYARKLPRPTWAQWMAAYPPYRDVADPPNPTAPGITSDDYLLKLGGEFLEKNPDGSWKFENTCTARWSRGWIYAICPLPRVPQNRQLPKTPLYTLKASDAKYYAIRVAEAREWMSRVWGPAPVDVTKTPGTPFDKTRLQDMKGILCFTQQFADATGHIDVWDGTGTYTHDNNPAGKGTGYWEDSSRVEFWPLAIIGPPAPGLPAPGPPRLSNAGDIGADGMFQDDEEDNDIMVV